MSPSNCFRTTPADRISLVVCNGSAKLHYALWCWTRSLLLQTLLSLSPPFTSPEVGGGSPPPGREIRLRLMEAPLPVLAARDPLLDRRGRSCLPFAPPPTPTAPVSIDAVAPDVAGVTLGCVRGEGERPGAARRLPNSGGVEVPRGYRSSISGLRLPSYPRAAF